MNRYHIYTRETGADRETLHVAVDSNPHAIVKALRAKTRRLKRSIFEAGARRYTIPAYESVKLIDTETETEIAIAPETETPTPV
jgi:hypothetical protein